MQTNDTLDRAPQALTYKVLDLVLDARRGRIRVPQFQRDFKWNAEDVRRLFDSIYRGYPVGSLLFWRRPESPSGPTRIGPVQIHNPDQADVRWLVDGQQRVTSLTATLTEVRDPDSRFDVYFDPSSHKFELAGARGPEEHWVAVHRLFDAADLGDFLQDWAPGLQHRDWSRALHDVGRNIRDYQLPAYLIESDDVSILREIFRRSNRSGKQLTEPEVFNALDKPTQKGVRPIESIEDAIGVLNWGQLDKRTLLAAVLTNEKLNPTLKIDKQLRLDSSKKRLVGATDRLLPGFYSAVSFMKNDAAIPHRRLLPYKTPLIILPALFTRHPTLTSRQRRLLVRWVWRGFTTGFHKPSNQIDLRQAAAIVTADDQSTELVIERLLKMVPNNHPAWAINPTKKYLSRNAMQRIGVLGLSHLNPRHLLTGGAIDISTLLMSAGPKALLHLTKPSDLPYNNTIANRTLHPKEGGILKAIIKRANHSTADPVLASHAMNQMSIEFLLKEEISEFLTHRATTINRVVNNRISAHAEWAADDTPGLRALLERAS